MKKIFSLYFDVPLVWRILTAFFLGIALGICASRMPREELDTVLPYVEPFGTLLISMLKMIVFPIIFFSLIIGAASLSLKKSGKLGGSVLLWYFFTSTAAALFGIVSAILLNPKMSGALEAAAGHREELAAMKNASSGGGLDAFLVSLFQNPFQALAEGRFLAIVVFSILFGLAARVLLESSKTSEKEKTRIESFLDICRAASSVSFKLIDWLMEYFPFGVFALSFVNFARNGVLLFGPYLRIVVCVIACVSGMILLVYPLALFVFCRQNPYKVLLALRAPIVTAFATRSSAAALPISLRTAQKLGVSPSLSSFSLPLGCTINMDGVCVHLPVFVILASNIFGIPFTASQMAILLVSVIFASVGAGGVPGGSVFLLFMVLENAGFDPSQTATIVALALGINPILDMFETACNVTGDNVCTYIVAKQNGLLEVGSPKGALENDVRAE
ncbi:MAG: dicarboxylate/amino acid:cation symporter [Thermoguttaceae bacterium]|nr:dicarboxylate/amino acid:cation symporter [Thermoguttaceae bacterium]